MVALEGYPSWAIEAAVRKFLRGQVDGASKAFCPRPPEISAAVRSELEHVYDEIDKAKRKAEFKEGQPAPRGNSPFERMQAKARAENAHLTVLFDDVSHARFLELHKSRQIPVGGKWVAALGIVYGPPTVASREAAE